MVRDLIRAESKLSSLPPWHDTQERTFYLIGLGYLFEATMEDVLRAELEINLKMLEYRYLNLNHVLMGFGLPLTMANTKKYFWDFRDEDDMFVTIDFVHERLILDNFGDNIECIAIRFGNPPEDWTW